MTPPDTADTIEDAGSRCHAPTATQIMAALHDLRVRATTPGAEIGHVLVDLDHDGRRHVEAFASILAAEHAWRIGSVNGHPAVFCKRQAAA